MCDEILLVSKPKQKAKAKHPILQSFRKRNFLPNCFSHMARDLLPHISFNSYFEWPICDFKFDCIGAHMSVYGKNFKFLWNLALSLCPHFISWVICIRLPFNCFLFDALAKIKSVLRDLAPVPWKIHPLLELSQRMFSKCNLWNAEEMGL